MEEQLNNKQNKKVTVFAIMLSLVSIGLLVFGFSLVSSDKVVMLQSISNLSSKMENAIKNSELYDKIASSKDVGIKATFDLKSDYVDVNANLVMDYLENREDKKSRLDLDLSMNDQDLLGLEGVLANDSLYFYIDDITPNYYHTALEYVNVISSLKGNDYDKLLTLLKESVSDYIDNDQIKKEKVKITYNGKDKKVNKLSYEVTNEAVAGMITNFLDSLEKEKDLLKNLANYMNMTEEELKTSIEEFRKELTYDEVETSFYYNVYYYGFNKIVGYELADIDNKPVIEYKVEEKETINFYNNETVIVSIEVAKKKNYYEFSGFIYDTDSSTKIPFAGSLKDNTFTIVFTQDGVDIQLVVTSNQEIKDNNYIYKNQIILSADVDGTEITMGTLDVGIEYYFNQKVDANVSNSINVEEISEEDLAIIENNLMNHPIYEFVSTLLGTIESSL